ncbi:MAG: zinc ABC transporter substrate-binding protein [Rhodospirillaceae bacterium]|jgi:zinc/manganese transport system substrate-binding protein|nr:zinc ABC transporter substrate-binding protein [Rhodospirillaceae bacterium]
MLKTIMINFAILNIIWFEFGFEYVSAKEINVVTSFSVLADMVQQIGKSHVKVNSLIGPCEDPHVYEPKPSDLNILKHANLIFVNGLGLEGWINRLFISSETNGKIIIVSDGIHTITNNIAKNKTVIDPHAWNNVTNAIVYATNIERALIEADQDDADEIRLNSKFYIEQLRALDSWAKKEIDSIPMPSRKVITNHNSLSYLGDAYDITFLTFQGISSESEPTATQVASLIKQIRDEKVKAIFIENQSDSRLMTQIIKESNIKLSGELYPEALSKQDGVAPTYIKAFIHNIKLLKAGMLGE